MLAMIMMIINEGGCGNSDAATNDGDNDNAGDDNNEDNDDVDNFDDEVKKKSITSVCNF
jgi:hypothetical protein